MTRDRPLTSLALLLLLCITVASPPAFAQISVPAPPVQSSSVTVRLGAEARATFMMSEGVVRALEVDIDATRTALSLAGCIAVRGVRFESTRLEADGSPGSFGVTFEMGPPDTIVRLAFEGGALKSATLDRSGTAPDDVLCPSVPGRSLASPAQLVQRLRGMPAAVVPSVTDEDAALRERLRIDTYRQLHAHGDAGVDALASALRDRDTNMRQNAAAMLNVLAGGWMVQTGLQKRSVIRAVPALVQALDDPDPVVRFMAATTIRDSGENGAPAVPTLIRMITDGDHADRTVACLALGGIGPSARAALPALKAALDDQDPVTRAFAENAIASITGTSNAWSAPALPQARPPTGPDPAVAEPADPLGVDRQKQR